MTRIDFDSRRHLALHAVVLLAILAGAWPARAHDDNWMHVWANEPSANSYAPSSTYSHNALGAYTWIERSGVGMYQVYFSGADLDTFSGGSAGSPGRQVTAYGASGAYCDVDQGLYPANVHCFDATGSPADTRFNLIITGWHDRGTPHPYVTVAAMQPSASSYVPVEPFTHADLVTRTGVGRYLVEFDDFYGGGGSTAPRNAQVVAEHSNTTGSGHYCSVVNWGNLTMTVQCFDAAGAAADTAFYAHMQREYDDVETVAFAWADAPATASYSPSSLYVSNPGGGAVTATRTSTGVYSMHFDGFDSVGVGGGHAQVSAYGQTGHRCSISGWGSDTVGVRCFDAAGAPADTRYSLLFRKRFSTLFTRNLALAEVTGVSASHTVDPYQAWNPRFVGTERGPVEFTRSGVGDYTVTFDGFGVFGDDGGVTLATSKTSSVPCKVEFWSGDQVHVGCFDLTGARADASFQVAYLKPEDDIATLGYVYKASPSASNEIANTFYAHNPSGGQVATAKLGTGFYRVTFTGISAYGENQGVPIVTGYGSNSDRCQLVFWTGDYVDVACFSGTGLPKDSQFVLAWFKPDRSTDGVIAALADLPTEPSYFSLPSKTHFPIPGRDAWLYRYGTGGYEMRWSATRQVGFEEYGFASTVNTTAVPCGSRVDFSDHDMNCVGAGGSSADTQYVGVMLSPTRLPEPGAAAQMLTGVLSLVWLARRTGAKQRGRVRA